MSSRQEELHSHQFTLQRAATALVLRQADPPYAPARRGIGSILASVLIAGLAVAAVAAYGVLRPGGGTQWREPGAVIIEKESGARLVYLDGKLHTVLNFTSALLIVGGPGHVVSVSRRAIEGVPRGVPLGIPGAPDSLPTTSDLTDQPWRVCTAAVRSESGAVQPRSVLLAGVPVAGGSALGERGLLVRVAADSYLIWHGNRYDIGDARTKGALGWAGAPDIEVSAALVNALSAGPAMAPMAVPHRGDDASGLPGHRIGEVVVVDTPDGGQQYALADSGGLAPISEVQASLLLGDPRTKRDLGQDKAIALSAADFNALPRLPDRTPRGVTAPPATIPALVETTDPAGGVCAAVADATNPASVSIDVPLPASDAAPTGGRTAAGAVLADRVVVPPGHGVLVEALAGPEAVAGTLCLVTDLGIAYPLATADVAAVLGYAGAAPVRRPAALVALLPAGRALDPTAARAPAAIGE
jgi:type VII secretion protein EccB